MANRDLVTDQELEDARSIVRQTPDNTTREDRLRARRIVQKALGRDGPTSGDIPGDGLAKGAGQAIESKQRKRRSLLDRL